MTQLRLDASEVIIAGFPAGPIPPELVASATGGFILFKRNLGTLEETLALTTELARLETAGLPPLLGIDQEGGRVARLGPPVLTLPPMRVLGGIDDVALTLRLAEVLGRQLRSLGFSVDFAPVLDVDTNPANPVIGDRSFGRTPDEVIRHGLAFARGLDHAGIAACAKHFPGHGDTELDSHLDLPRLDHDLSRLMSVELAPFARATGVPMWMTAHVIFSVLDDRVPATLSRRAMTELVRDKLGYRGVVVSDDLEMRAISDRYGIPEAACLAIEAGCDALLICSDVSAVVGSQEALTRKAEADGGFRTRLNEAAGRVRALRERHRAAPVQTIEQLRSVIQGKGSVELERELSLRMSNRLA